jgi:hypothetical protein
VPNAVVGRRVAGGPVALSFRTCLTHGDRHAVQAMLTTGSDSRTIIATIDPARHEDECRRRSAEGSAPAALATRVTHAFIDAAASGFAGAA